MKTTILFLANVADQPAELLGLANELSIEADGWALIPYGDSQHSGADGRHLANEAADKPKAVIQRFDRASADAVVNEFNSPLTRFKRFIVGLPIFKGHPDAKRFAARFPDKTPHGTIAAVEATDRGLRFKPVLTREGVDLVEKEGWSAFSPYWPSRQVGEENGKRIFSPFKLVSIGLLPPGRENIAGLSLANATEGADDIPFANENEKPMKQILINLLAKMGIPVSAEATEQQLSAHVTQAEGFLAAANAKDAEITQLKAQATTLTTELATANAAKTEVLTLANAKETDLKAKLAAERTARAKLVVLGAVKTGRVIAAEVEAETLALVNATDFDAAATAIDARAPKLNTQSQLDDLRKAKEQKSRTDTVLDLVNAKMDEPTFKAMPPEKRYDAAFAAVADDPKYAAIFAAMKVPGKA